jgi:hypothetical protein
MENTNNARRWQMRFNLAFKGLKYCVDVNKKPFTLICNSPLTSEIYPERFNYAIVWPIHKKEIK